jgi:hypothetical protein
LLVLGATPKILAGLLHQLIAVKQHLHVRPLQSGILEVWNQRPSAPRLPGPGKTSCFLPFQTLPGCCSMQLLAVTSRYGRI